MDWDYEKQKKIEFINEALEELRQLQRDLSRYVREYTINSPSDAEVFVALQRINCALDIGNDYFDELTPCDPEERGR